MLALSIRQPYAELILRGIKTIEYRSRSTNIIGQRFLIYASKGGSKRRPSIAQATRPLTSDNLTVAVPPPWMAELANGLRLFPHELPTGVIVGSAVIDRVTQGADFFEWHLADVERLKKPRKPEAHPQPVWWRNEA